MKLFTIILFAVTYILMIALPKKRPYVALISAVIFVVSGAMPLASVFTAIDWNVLLMLAGTMGTVALFIESKMPERMADLLLQKTPNVMWVAVALSVFAGVVSAFVDNVATVLRDRAGRAVDREEAQNVPGRAAHLHRRLVQFAGCGYPRRRYDVHHAGRLRQHGLFGLHLHGRQMLHLLCR